MVKVVRKTQALSINPSSELLFKGDPSETNTARVHIFNPLSQRVGFKILTNVPHILFVRPAYDVIPPEGSCTVNVISQASSETEHFKTHKLLIQSIVMPPNPEAPVDKLIASQSSSEEVMETKLSCVFQVSYTSEMTLPLENGGDHGGRSEVTAATPKTSNRFNFYALLTAILVCAVAYLVYHFRFRSEDDYDSADVDDVGAGMMDGVEDVVDEIGEEMAGEVEDVVDGLMEEMSVEVDNSAEGMVDDVIDDLDEELRKTRMLLEDD